MSQNIIFVHNYFYFLFPAGCSACSAHGSTLSTSCSTRDCSRLIDGSDKEVIENTQVGIQKDNEHEVLQSQHDEAGKTVEVIGEDPNGSRDPDRQGSLHQHRPGRHGL